MLFNPDFFKKSWREEVLLSQKATRVDHPVVTSSHHIKEKISKACKGIGMIRKLHYMFLGTPIY